MVSWRAFSVVSRTNSSGGRSSLVGVVESMEIVLPRCDLENKEDLLRSLLMLPMSLVEDSLCTWEERGDEGGRMGEDERREGGVGRGAWGGEPRGEERWGGEGVEGREERVSGDGKEVVVE